MAQLTPRYGSEPIITLDGPPSAILTPAVRQRQRLLDIVTDFTEEQWQHPSRCDEWSSRDVISHLDSTNGFWAASILAGCDGNPTRFLATFDPVQTPVQLVIASSAMSSAEVLERFAASTTALVEVLSGLDDAGWTATAEGPPGHMRVTDIVHHALWDSWVHERDILAPQGIESVCLDDEIAASLRYALALAPGLAVSSGERRTGTIVLAATNPDVAVVVTVDNGVHLESGSRDDADLVIRGDAIEILEGLSLRSPLPSPVPDHAAWLIAGLSTTFDQSGSPALA